MVNKKRKEGLRQRVFYSESYRKQVVKEIEEEGLGVLAASRKYGIGYQTIYMWLYKYSKNLKKKGILVRQMESEESKTKELEKRIAELERIIGQKQMQIDFLEKAIEIGSGELGVDIKKKYFTTP